MQFRLQHLLFVTLVVSLVSLAYGLNYLYYSNVETTRLGDRIKWWHGDTLNGPIRSNAQFAIEQDPQFYDFAITSAANFWMGPGYDPHFHNGFGPVFNAPRLELPTSAAWLRTQAIQQGHYFNQGGTMQAKVHIEGDSLRIWWTQLDSTLDTTQFSFHTLPDSAIAFFDCPKLDVWGTVSHTLIMATSGRAGMADNILYASSDATHHGLPVANHGEKFALIAEGDVKVLNTWANGREDSHNRGNGQTNPDSTSIFLNGYYCSLRGSFTFDEQNDADSGYVFQHCGDDRGTIYLWGGVLQRQRGYVHRATPVNCPTGASTGYLKYYLNDEQLRFWNIGIFDATVRENVAQPNAVNFGNVAVGDTARDTVSVFNDFVPIHIDTLRVPPDFRAAFPTDTGYLWQQRIPIQFVPSHGGFVDDSVHFYIAYYHRWYAVAVSGVGISARADPFSVHPSAFSLSSSPNPFNSSTRIAFSLPQAGSMRLNVYDLSGRLIRTLADGRMESGEHSVSFDAGALPSGLYFARLQTASRVLTQKLLLVK